MRHRTTILVAATLLVLIGGAAAVYAYDSSRDDLIADGVRIAGVDVGGMRVPEARTTVLRELRPQLERPVVLTAHRREFRLSPREARLRPDVGGMVDAGLQESREGNILARVARNVTGGRKDVDVPARVSYSQAALDALVRRVRRTLDRPARDARLEFPSLSQVQEQRGIRVRTGVLRRRLVHSLTEPRSARAVRVPTTVIQPKVTREQLARHYPVLLVVDRTSFKLKLYKRLRLVRAYTVAVGAQGFDTPAGLYHIQDKAVNPAWHVPKKPWAGALAGRVIPGGTPDNPIKERWLGIFNGAGIHGTDETYSLGHRASHGCVRMAIPDVIGLYPQVPIGAPIYIG